MDSEGTLPAPDAAELKHVLFGRLTSVPKVPPKIRTPTRCGRTAIPQHGPTDHTRYHRSPLWLLRSSSSTSQLRTMMNPCGVNFRCRIGAGALVAFQSASTTLTGTRVALADAKDQPPTQSPCQTPSRTARNKLPGKFAFPRLHPLPLALVKDLVDREKASGHQHTTEEDNDAPSHHHRTRSSGSVSSEHFLL